MRATVATVGDTSAQLALRDPDIRIMLEVRADQPGAFEELVQRYQARLITVLMHLVGNAQEAEDLAQEVFLRVYRARSKYRPKSKFSTWLFTIANNLALNALRARQRKPEVPLPVQESGPLGPRPQEQMVPDPHSGPMTRLDRHELAQVIRQALDNLNERQRMAVILNKYEDMGYAEIAEVMQLTTKAIKSLLSRARMNLRQMLAGYLGMDPGAMGDEEDVDEGEE
jgi:RNA polymerase sigma-70 factor (ECF subfamily)